MRNKETIMHKKIFLIIFTMMELQEIKRNKFKIKIIHLIKKISMINKIININNTYQKNFLIEFSFLLKKFNNVSNHFNKKKIQKNIRLSHIL